MHAESLTSGPTIIIGRKGSFGEVHFSEGPCSPIDTTYYVTANQTDAFLPWLTRRLRCLDLEQLNRAAAIPGLNRKDAYRQKLLLPPLAEQKWIAEILDTADALRVKRRESLAQLDTLLKSIFLEMFGDPVTNPMGWEVKSLSDVASVKRGKFSPRPRNDPSYYNGEYPFIQTGDIANSGGYVSTWKQTLNYKGTKVSKCFDPGTILIAIVGATIGRTAILSISAFCPDSVVGISVKPNIAVPVFLEIVLRSKRAELLKRAPQTARANLNLEILKPIPIILPPHDLQQRFAAIVESIEEQKVRMRSHLAELENLFTLLQQCAFKGELSQ